MSHLHEQADSIFHLYLQNYFRQVASTWPFDRANKHRPTYTNEDSEKSKGDVTSGKMSKRHYLGQQPSSLKYAIPRSTLVDKLSG